MRTAALLVALATAFTSVTAHRHMYGKCSVENNTCELAFLNQPSIEPHCGSWDCTHAGDDCRVRLRDFKTGDLNVMAEHTNCYILWRWSAAATDMYNSQDPGDVKKTMGPKAYEDWYEKVEKIGWWDTP